ncbi:hypothetical protein AMECASPLE_026033, partial [Ameca splendens]
MIKRVLVIRSKVWKEGDVLSKDSPTQAMDLWGFSRVEGHDLIDCGSRRDKGKNPTTITESYAT